MTGYHGVRNLRAGTSPPAPPRRPAVSRPPRLEDVADADALVATFDRLAAAGGRAPGPDGVRYRDLSRADRAAVCRALAGLIRDGRFAPGPVRAVSIPKKAGATRTLRLANVADRVVFALANDVMSPFLDPTFSPRSHGFRPGRGVATLLAALEAETTAGNLWVLAVDDARKAFDEVSTGAVVKALTERITDTGLAAFLGVLVRGHAGPGRCKGIDQGSALSPLGLNAALHANHDVPVYERGQRPGYRYADNFVYAARSLTEGTQVHGEAAELLGKAGLVFKGGDAHHLVDLERGDELPLLGLILRRDGDQIAYRMDETAWGKLRDHLRDAHRSEDPPETTRAVTGGWVSSLGPALAHWTDADSRRVADTVDGLGLEVHLSREWFRGVVEGALVRWGEVRREALLALGGVSGA